MTRKNIRDQKDKTSHQKKATTQKPDQISRSETWSHKKQGRYYKQHPPCYLTDCFKFFLIFSFHIIPYRLQMNGLLLFLNTIWYQYPLVWPWSNFCQPSLPCQVLFPAVPWVRRHPMVIGRISWDQSGFLNWMDRILDRGKFSGFTLMPYFGSETTILDSSSRAGTSISVQHRMQRVNWQIIIKIPATDWF